MRSEPIDTDRLRPIMAVMTSPSAEFLIEIRDAATRLGFTPKTLCQKAVRNHRLVDRLEAGERVTLQTVTRFREFVANAERARVA